MPSAVTISRLGRACIAGFTLAVLPATLIKAEFGPRTTIGVNYQQWSNTQSANGIDPGSCGGIFCYVLFQPPPDRQPLIIGHVACIANDIGGDLTYAVLGSLKGNTQEKVRRFSPLVPVFTNNTFWVVNSPVMHLIESGERPYISFHNFIKSAGDWILSCSISGRLQQR